MSNDLRLSDVAGLLEHFRPSVKNAFRQIWAGPAAESWLVGQAREATFAFSGDPVFGIPIIRSVKMPLYLAAFVYADKVSFVNIQTRRTYTVECLGIGKSERDLISGFIHGFEFPE